MPNQMTININQEYIQLDQLLKLCNAVASGGEAHRMVEMGLVRLNGQEEVRKRAKIRPGDTVELPNLTITVSPAASQSTRRS